METQNSTQQPESQNNGSIPFEVRYFEQETYTKVVHTHVNIFQLFFSYLNSKGIATDPNELSDILNKYEETYVKLGSSLGDVPEGSKCQHIYTRGTQKKDTMCGSNAKYWGVEGKPKCGSHKSSKASKSIPADGVGSANKQNSVFNYKDNKNVGIVQSQNLTTLQKSVKEQSKPENICLTKNAAGIVYNPESRIVFIEKEDKQCYAIGLLNEDGASYGKLTNVETYICYANGWKWDMDCVEEENTSENPLVSIVESDNPLVSNQSDIIQSKIERYQMNN